MRRINVSAESTLNSLATSIFKDYIGFTPTSNSIKPPHIANSLFRNCIGETFDTSDIHKWIVAERKGNDKTFSAEQILSTYPELIENNQSANVIKNIKEFRYLLNEIFNTDNTVYPSLENSVYTISSHWLVKKSVPAESGIGSFLFEILSKLIDGKRSPAIDAIKKALSNDKDDFTKILKPIITCSDDEKKVNHTVDFPEENDIKWDKCKATIRKGFDNLIENMIATGESKNSLLLQERIINYSMFALVFYLINVGEAYGNNGVPILFDAGNEAESIKKASEQSYTLAKRSVEQLFIKIINEILITEIPTNNKAACLSWIREMRNDNTIIDAVEGYFESFINEQPDDPIFALSRALQIALFTFQFKSSSPSDFCRYIGVRGGFVAPKGNRAKVKRFLINSFTLETISLSVMDKNDLIEIEYRDLGKKLYDSYSIILGTDPENDYSVLEKMNITQSTPGDLRGDLAINAQTFADTYISLGRAKKYADGITVIKWR